jgi:hypothetical protein
LWSQVGFTGFPGFGDFDKDGGDESLQWFLTGEETYDSGAAFDLAVEGFAGVGGSQLLLGRLGQIEDGEAFGGILFLAMFTGGVDVESGLGNIQADEGDVGISLVVFVIRWGHLFLAMQVD